MRLFLGGAVGKAAVAPRPVAQLASNEGRQCGVVRFELVPGIDFVVGSVVLAVAIEPRLHALSPIFSGIGAGIKPLPQPPSDRFLIGFFKFLLKARIDGGQAHLMNDMSEFVDQNVFREVGVPLQAE